jgi:RNA recognition motif-containing protein
LFFSVNGFKVAGANVFIDKNSGKPKGYGLVTFYKQEEADRAIKALDNVVI